jgi:hypothetical protein
MDKVLNGFNSAAEKVLIGKFILRLARFTGDLPAQVLAHICKPLWETKEEKSDPGSTREMLLKKARSGFYPISIMGLFVAIYFGLLIIL